jgi:hypothetical protein
LHTGSDIVPALSTPLTFAVETAHLTFWSLAVTLRTSSLILKNFTCFSHCFCVFCADIRTNIDYFTTQH